MKDTEKVLKDLIDKSFSEFNLVQGSLVKASVLEIGKKWVTLDVGFKSDGLVPLEEFQDHKNESTKKVYAAQNILIQQDPGFNDASPMYATETYKRFGPIILEGPCANYGCAYNVDQSSSVEIF